MTDEKQEKPKKQNFDTEKMALILLSKVKEEVNEDCCRSSLDADNIVHKIDRFFEKLGIEDTWDNPYYKQVNEK